MSEDALRCPHRPRCPGCPLLEQPYSEQLEYKTKTLTGALASYSVLARASVAQARPADPVTAFRLRSKLVVEGRALGLFARGTHEVVDVAECLVLRPRIKAVAAAVRAALPLPERVSSLDLREADAGVLVTAAVPPSVDAGRRRALAEHLAGLAAGIASVAVSTREADAPQLLGAALEVLVGPGELQHCLDPNAPWHYAAHGAFVQAHAGQFVRLHEAVEAELLGETSGGPARSLAGRRVLELYAGSGALSLRLAAHGARVTLVESFAPAVRLAERAAHEQDIALTTLAADAAVALVELARRRERFDAVIVDPPRRGLAPAVRRRIAELEPERLLYVSCEPETLARDAAHFALLGYGLEVATPFDMIPQTDAVETLARFVRREAPLPDVLAEDVTFIGVDKPPHEAVTHGAGRPHGAVHPHATAHALLARVRRLPGAEHSVALDVLAPEASGVCLFAKTPRAASKLKSALAGATAEYLVLARGVMHERGTLPLKASHGSRPRYERLAVHAGHSLLAVRAPYGDVLDLARACARIGHPVLGDARHGDRRSNAHFSHRHALDRLFIHRRALELVLHDRPHRLEASLAPDLTRVLAHLDPSQDH